MAIPSPNQNVLNARARRGGSLLSAEARVKSFIDQVTSKIQASLEERVQSATMLVFTKTIQNISRPVTKGIGPRGGRVVIDRSLPGEYPKAETTQLMKTLFWETRKLGKDVVEGYVGTPLDYGLILETRMNRSFLVRTLNENRKDVDRLIMERIE